MVFCQFNSNFLIFLTNEGLLSGHSSIKIIFLNTLRTVPGLTCLCKLFLYFCSQFLNTQFSIMSYLSQNPSFLTCCKSFYALPHVTSKPVSFFIPLNNMLNSSMTSLDDFGYSLQRISVVKMLNYQLAVLQGCVSTHSQ
jgi:hypothetical protein